MKANIVSSGGVRLLNQEVGTATLEAIMQQIADGESVLITDTGKGVRETKFDLQEIREYVMKDFSIP